MTIRAIIRNELEIGTDPDTIKEVVDEEVLRHRREQEARQQLSLAPAMIPIRSMQLAVWEEPNKGWRIRFPWMKDDTSVTMSTEDLEKWVGANAAHSLSVERTTPDGTVS